MKILILGTSNSILRTGYPKTLATHPAVTSIVNRSLGASASIRLGYDRDVAPFAGSDIVLVDFCPNDEQHNINLPYLNNIDVAFHEMLANIVANPGCIPVVLALPKRSAFLGSGPAYDRWLALCRAFRVPFFDARVFLCRLQAKMSLSVEALFWDEMHFSPSLAPAMAMALGDQLAMLEPAPPIVSLRVRQRCFRFSGLDDWDLADVPTYLGKTSQGSMKLAPIAHPGGVTATLPAEAAQVAGIAANARKTDAPIIVRSGSGERIIDVGPSMFNPSSPPAFIFPPCLPLPIVDQQVWIGAGPRPGKADPVVELAGLIYVTTHSGVTTPLFGRDNIDLVANISDEAIEAYGGLILKPE